MTLKQLSCFYNEDVFAPLTQKGEQITTKGNNRPNCCVTHRYLPLHLNQLTAYF